MKTRTSFLKPGLFMLFVLTTAVLITAVGSAYAKPVPSEQTDEVLLSKQVHHELVMLPWYGVFDNLQYTINGSEVTLSGQVFQPITKSDAAAAVEGSRA